MVCGCLLHCLVLDCCCCCCCCFVCFLALSCCFFLSLSRCDCWISELKNPRAVAPPPNRLHAVIQKHRNCTNYRPKTTRNGKAKSVQMTNMDKERRIDRTHKPRSVPPPSRLWFVSSYRNNDEERKNECEKFHFRLKDFRFPLRFGISNSTQNQTINKCFISRFTDFKQQINYRPKRKWNMSIETKGSQWLDNVSDVWR